MRLGFFFLRRHQNTPLYKYQHMALQTKMPDVNCSPFPNRQPDQWKKKEIRMPFTYCLARKSRVDLLLSSIPYMLLRSFSCRHNIFNKPLNCRTLETNQLLALTNASRRHSISVFSRHYLQKKMPKAILETLNVLQTV